MNRLHLILPPAPALAAARNAAISAALGMALLAALLAPTAAHGQSAPSNESKSMASPAGTPAPSALSSVPADSDKDKDKARPALTVAVLPFETTLAANKGKATEIATLFAASLSAIPDVWLVEREEIDKLLGEQSIALSGLADPATVARSGRIIGARVIITGRFIPTGDSAVLVAKVISVETSRVFGETATWANISNAAELEVAIRSLTDKVAAVLVHQKAVFDPIVDQSAKILAKMREAAAGKKLPKLCITVTEKDIRQTSSIDPALQTEMEIRLADIGFTLVTRERADVVITGEAFSETGTRHGDLISARARGEIRATRISDKAVLAVDRETAAAIDTTASAAGKTALQNAGLALANRLAQKLIPAQ